MTRFTVPSRFEQEGWPEQLRRVERWHARALAALRASRDSNDSDTIDFVYAFFQAAYHLADWLKNSGAAPRTDVENFVNSTTALVFCRDICNGSKHFRLDKRQRSKSVGLMREYIPPSHGRPAGSAARLFAFEAQDGSVDFADIEELMSDCVQMWRGYCEALRDPALHH